MRILVFTEGTLLIGQDEARLTRPERIQAVREKIGRLAAGGPPIDFSAEVPAGDAVQKLRAWRRQGAEIMHLTSRTRPDENENIWFVLGFSSFATLNRIFTGCSFGAKANLIEIPHNRRAVLQSLGTDAPATAGAMTQEI